MKTIENTRYYKLKELEQTLNIECSQLYKLRVLDSEMQLINEPHFLPKSHSFNNVVHYSELQIPKLKKAIAEMTDEKKAVCKKRIKEYYAEINKENKELNKLKNSY